MEILHYTDEHELETPQSLPRQAARVLEFDDEMTSGFTSFRTRVRSWWRRIQTVSASHEMILCDERRLECAVRY